MGEKAPSSPISRPELVHEDSISMRAGELIVSAVFRSRADYAEKQTDVPEKVRTIARNIPVLPLGPVLSRNFHRRSSNGPSVRVSSIAVVSIRQADRKDRLASDIFAKHTLYHAASTWPTTLLPSSCAAAARNCLSPRGKNCSVATRMPCSIIIMTWCWKYLVFSPHQTCLCHEDILPCCDDRDPKGRTLQEGMMKVKEKIMCGTYNNSLLVVAFFSLTVEPQVRKFYDRPIVADERSRAGDKQILL